MPDQSQYDQRAAERAHDLTNDLGKKLTEASTRDAQEAIKVILLVNSGAAIAILAFISTLASRPGSGITFAELKAVTNSLNWFASGTIASGLTAACAYVANSFYAGHFFSREKIWFHPYVKENATSRRMMLWGRIFHWVGFLLGFAALVMFVRGVYVASRAIGKLVS